MDVLNQHPAIVQGPEKWEVRIVNYDRISIVKIGPEVKPVGGGFKSYDSSGNAEKQQNSKLCRDDLLLRHVRYSYLILLSQLMLPFAATAVFTFVDPVREWGYSRLAFMVSAPPIFIVILITMTTMAIWIGKKYGLVKQPLPGTLLCLQLCSICLSHLCAAAASISIGLGVMLTLGITMVSVLACVCMGIQTKARFSASDAMLGAVIGSVVVAVVGCLIVHFLVVEEPILQISKTQAYILVGCGSCGGMVMSMVVFYATKLFIKEMETEKLLERNTVALTALQLYLVVMVVFLLIFCSGEKE